MKENVPKVSEFDTVFNMADSVYLFSQKDRIYHFDLNNSE